MFFRSVLILLLLLGLNGTNVFADEYLLTIRPVQMITSAQRKDLQEGDEYNFKVVENIKNFKAGDIITGQILKYEPNGFAGQEAKIVLGNFRTQNGERVKGNVYVSGSQHGTFQEYANKSSFGVGVLIRGGEIKLKPDEDITFFVEK